jgi:endonuclease-3
VNALREHYGPSKRPPTTDPFELVLLENVAYLATPARRRAAFDLLKHTVGTTPEAILAANRKTLESITERGILKSTFAAKLRECAAIATERFGGDLGAAIRGPLESARQALRSFPGIGEPGAEKILLFTGQQALLAPESNGLRVLVRLGFVREERAYSKTYAASRQAAHDLSGDVTAMQTAHLLLQHHGQTLCKRNDPRCGMCPLGHVCPYALSPHDAAGSPLQATKGPGSTAKPLRGKRPRG